MDTIAAIASGGGVLSAVGIVRVSGADCFSICDQIFLPNGSDPLSARPPRQMVLGRLLGTDGQIIDSCLAVRFPAPHSYTGENSVEFHCHGSPVVLDEALRALFAHGARQAGRGEFTKRAFLNGNLDLTQAEAVIDLIESETVQAAHNAVEQLGGALRGKIEPIYDRLLDIASQFYAVVDYPDEDIEDLQREDMIRIFRGAASDLTDLLSTAQRGRLLRQGVPTVILGRPNVGKSSLLNALLGYDRAIVTDIPGTTRDTVEEKAVVGSTLLRLIDTAGIRTASDDVERLGVERSLAAASGAELALLVLDGASPITEEDEDAIRAAQLVPRLLVLVNKSDLPLALDLPALSARFGTVLSLSARDGTGFSALEAAVSALFPTGEVPPGQILTNARQAEAVSRALDAIRASCTALESGLTPDAALSDVERAVNALGEITGRTLREDLTARIFERFCVGK